MAIRTPKPVRIEPLILTDESTVVGSYEAPERPDRGYESEAQLEQRFIEQLQVQAYEYVRFRSEAEVIANLRSQLEALNDYRFSDDEWQRFFAASISTHGGPDGDIVAKTRRIQEDHVQVLIRDNGESKNIHLIDKQHIHRNRLQVTNQYVAAAPTAANASHTNRYDVTILVNGLPLVHVELKRRSIDIREAFNQINRYQRDSFWAGAGLFGYVQIFLISNGTYTKYYANTTRLAHLTENGTHGRQTKAASSDSFEFTSWWTDADNKPITDLLDVTRTFLAKHTILSVLTRYCVFTTANNLMVMRPYQIAATEAILRRINTASLNHQIGTPEAGGYIWHTTGSGKTLTSFKTAKLAAGMEGIEKVIFVVDRKDLDHQTIKEYNRFAEGTVSANQSTTQLAAQINDPFVRIIVTTIQKLSTFVARHRQHDIYDGHVVLIFDECHRSQFGDMHTAITKAFRNYHLFGFTGTPIFAANAHGSSNSRLRTTEQAFGACLHRYTIVNAIADANVLPFRIDYIDTIKQRQHIDDDAVPSIDTEGALLAPQRISSIVSYILTHFDTKTKRSQAYTLHSKRVRGFNSLLATASIPAARAYYEEFRRQQAELPSDRRLSVGIIYSYAVNDDDPSIALADESIDPTVLSADDRIFLEGAIADYNECFGTAFSTAPQQFESYYEDISRRLTDRSIDLVIVVNMFLTGFDSKTLNTLWVDKPLRDHGLIQAYSRTNRILNSVKTYGNIVCFRPLQEATDKAVALFGNKDAQGIVTLRPYEEFLKEYLEVLAYLTDTFTPGERIDSEKAQRTFITTFGKLLRLRNILTSFDDFAADDPLGEGDFADYRSTYVDLYEQCRRRDNDDDTPVTINDDLVFEMELVSQVAVDVDYILMLVERYRDQLGGKDTASTQSGGNTDILTQIFRAIDSSPSLHSKRDLIADFVRSVSTDADVVTQWRLYLAQRRESELADIISAENLNEDATRALLAAAFRDGYLTSEGTAISAILPAMSRFQRVGEGYEAKKQRVVAALSAYVERFHGLGE